MTKPVNLTVHRNTVEKRRRREALDGLESCIRHERKENDIAGFALVTWDKNLLASAMFHSAGTKLTGALIPEFAKAQLARKIGDLDAERLIRRFLDIPDDSA